MSNYFELIFQLNCKENSLLHSTTISIKGLLYHKPVYAGDQLNHLLEIQGHSVGNNERNKLDYQL